MRYFQELKSDSRGLNETIAKTVVEFKKKDEELGVGINLMPKILQLKIALKGIKPPVWRRILVEDSISFHKLHEIIQRVMGWENYHLYSFETGGMEIGEPDEEDEEITDSRKVRLAQIMSEKTKILYTYDFGDNWEHIITVEKILEKESDKKYPLCIAGERACPPEDCGGDSGYEEFLEAIRNPKNEEHKEMLEWVGGEFDPEKFDVGKVNKELKRFQK